MFGSNFPPADSSAHESNLERCYFYAHLAFLPRPLTGLSPPPAAPREQSRPFLRLR
jgi:hypothetical protein